MAGLNTALSRGARAALAAMVMAGLAACSSDDEVAAPAEPPAPPKVLMTTITAMDFGRTFEGAVISVEGLAPGLGYQAPELRDHENGRISPDGFLLLDFVALPPSEELSETLPQPGGERALRVRAHRDVAISDLQGLRGVRVYTAMGAATRGF